MSIVAGTRLGHFEVVALIGAGGMGEVEAIWRRLSRQPKSRAERGISPND
jgi:hypothetical protein